MRSVLETMDQSNSDPNARPPTIIHSNNETSLTTSYKIAISYGAPRFKLCISKMPLHIFNACMYANSQNQQPLSIRTPFVDNGNNIPYSPPPKNRRCTATMNIPIATVWLPFKTFPYSNWWLMYLMLSIISMSPTRYFRHTHAFDSTGSSFENAEERLLSLLNIQ